MGWQWTTVAAGNIRAARLALGVVAGKLWCSSGEDEGTKGDGGIQRSFLNGRFSMGGSTPVRWQASHGG
jgi:hypothetical protein